MYNDDFIASKTGPFLTCLNASSRGACNMKVSVSSRGGSRNRAQGDDLRFSNTTGILQKKLFGLLVLKQSMRRVHPLLKKILDPPLSRLAVFVSRASGIDSVVYSFAVYKGIEPARRDLERALSQYYTLFRLVVLLKEHCEFAMLITFLFFF